jgi:uncharacterized membrane protein YhiD involved in acid resistance
MLASARHDVTHGEPLAELAVVYATAAVGAAAGTGAVAAGAVGASPLTSACVQSREM